MEEFYDLKRYLERFEITKTGLVRNKKTCNILKPYFKKDYFIVRLNIKGKTKAINLHRLLGETFLANPNNYKYVKFKDGNSKNYNLNNLEWVNQTFKKKIKKLKSGQKFGDYTVVADLGMVNKKHKIICKCDCGKEKETEYTLLNKSKRISCGCKEKIEIKSLDLKKTNKKLLKDKKVKKYIIKEISAKRVKGKIKRRVLTKCKDCFHECEVDYQGLSETKYNCISCRKIKTINKRKTETYKNKKLLRTVYSSMLQRCNNKNNPDYKNYGGRGIKVDSVWNKFNNFYKWSIENGWNKSLTIDRIDNDGNYSPNNCRFVNKAVQSRNNRNCKLDWDKVEYIRNSNKTVKQLSKKFNVKPTTIEYVIKFKTWKQKYV